LSENQITNNNNMEKHTHVLACFVTRQIIFKETLQSHINAQFSSVRLHHGFLLKFKIDI